MSKKFSLGIDTSCYTTSVGIISLDTNEIFENIKIPLKVKDGARGLRQSEGFYQHVLNLGNIFEGIPSEILSDLEYIVVSDKPRDVENSYMPVFNSGVSFAMALAAMGNVKLIKTSHQVGHILSGFVNRDVNFESDFISVHMSGGTTEILKTSLSADEFKEIVIGGTKDISAGQLIDRIGVKLGFSFPAGREIEKFLENVDLRSIRKLHFPVSVNGGFINFSGAEAYGYKYIEEGFSREEILSSLLNCIGISISKALKNILLDNHGSILITGGVAANDSIYENIRTNVNRRVFRPEKPLCTDNGVGLSYYPILKKNLEIKNNEIKNL